MECTRYEKDPESIHYDGAKPRALTNMMTRPNSAGEGWSGLGSCWINAGLQAVFSPKDFKKVFCKQWRRLLTPALTPLRTQLLEASSNTRDFCEAPRPPIDCNEQKMLATLFYCTHQEPSTRYLIPYLHADKHYLGAQEDAAEFLIKILGSQEEVPAMYPLLKGSVVETLRCLRPECQRAHDIRVEYTHAPCMGKIFGRCRVVSHGAGSCRCRPKSDHAGGIQKQVVSKLRMSRGRVGQGSQIY